MSSDIHPYKREGAWSNSHGFYYRCTYESLNRYREVLKRLESKEQEIADLNQDVEKRILSLIIHHETDELIDECYMEAISTQLFACMTLEAFINHYGVKRLGESFYKRNLERVGITEKISILILACCHKSIEQDNDLIRKMRDLFDARNQLVHPKSREIDFGRLNEFVSKHPRDFQLNEHIRDMEFIIDELCRLDTDISRELDFKYQTSEE